MKILEPRSANEQRVDGSLKSMANSVVESHPNGETLLSLCTFCNSPTGGLEKKLFATEQTKGPFFPVLANLQGSKTKLDFLGRAVVCGACFHHLLRQWSSSERRGVPIRKREYKVITGMNLISVIIHAQISTFLKEFPCLFISNRGFKILRLSRLDTIVDTIIPKFDSRIFLAQLIG